MRYSDPENQLKDSGLGELLALAGKPEMYNFSSGFPAEELFPLKELEEVNRAILAREGKQALCSPYFRKRLSVPCTVSGVTKPKSSSPVRTHS